MLGDHRLLCGESARGEDLDRLVGGQAMHLVNMDPPYNVKVEPRTNNAIAAGLSPFPTTHHQGLDVARYPSKPTATHAKLRPKDRPLANDFVSSGDFARMLRAWFANASRVLEPGRSGVAARGGVPGHTPSSKSMNSASRAGRAPSGRTDAPADRRAEARGLSHLAGHP